MMHILIEIIGWIGSVLILGSYFLNINGKLKSNSAIYIISNLLGGIFFTINTLVHHAYPSMIVNIIWVFIAIAALLKKDKTSSQIDQTT
jgi:DNA integrity scanning protein DisA with diadenylate cyclase activity